MIPCLLSPNVSSFLTKEQVLSPRDEGNFTLGVLYSFRGLENRFSKSSFYYEGRTRNVTKWETVSHLRFLPFFCFSVGGAIWNKVMSHQSAFRNILNASDFKFSWALKWRSVSGYNSSQIACLCRTCPQFLIPSGFQSWTGCLRRRAGRGGPWVLRYRGWDLRPLSCWVNRWGPRETTRCSWSRWGDSLSSDLDTRGRMTESKKSLSVLKKNGAVSSENLHFSCRKIISAKPVVMFMHTHADIHTDRIQAGSLDSPAASQIKMQCVFIDPLL